MSRCWNLHRHSGYCSCVSKCFIPFSKEQGEYSSPGYQERVSESHDMSGERVQLGDLPLVGLWASLFSNLHFTYNACGVYLPKALLRVLKLYICTLLRQPLKSTHMSIFLNLINDTTMYLVS